MKNTIGESDLRKTINSLNVGIVVVDKGLKIQLINNHFNKLWDTNNSGIKTGDHFRKLLEINRANGFYDLDDSSWEDYVSQHLDEIRKGNIEPRDLSRANGSYLIYTVTNLSYSRRLISYFDITDQKQYELKIEKAQTRAKESEQTLINAISALEDGFVIYDGEDKLVACNDAFRNQFGKAKRHLKRGRTFRQMTSSLIKDNIIPIEKGKEDEFLDDLIKRRNSKEGVEKTFKTHDGRWIRQRDTRSTSGNLVVGIRTDITEIKEREEQLEEIEQLFQITNAAIHQGIAVFDEGVLAYLNPSLTGMLDLENDSLKRGDTYKDFVILLMLSGHFGTQEEAEKVLPEKLDIINAKKSYRFERKGPSGKYFQVDVLPQENQRLIVSYTDITKRHKAYQLIEERKELVDSILNASESAILVTQGFNELISYNERALELFEYSKDEMDCIKTYKNFLGYQYDRETYDLSNMREFTKDSFVEFGLEVSKDAIKKVRTLFLSNGLVLRYRSRMLDNGIIVHSYINVTDEKKRQLELESAKLKAESVSHLQQKISNAMAQGLIVFQNEKLDFYNPQAKNLLELPDDILKIGQTLENFFGYQRDKGYYGDADEGTRFYSDILAKARAGVDYQVERTTRSNKTMRVNGVTDGKGQLILTFSDITDIKEREKQLEESKQKAEAAERAKSEFLANMSHEIRTPMNGVMGMAELLGATQLDAKQSMYTDVIINSGSSLLTIINDILDFSKIDAGQLELDTAPFNFAEAVEDVATLMSAKCAEKDLELIMRFDPNLPKMMVGDVGRLRQVITNLVGNAVKFTDQGHVFINIEGSIRTDKDNQYASLKLSVEDTGIGISEDGCQKVFNKFSQVDSSATRKHEGTGLGLSIAASLIELMNGEIKVDSTLGQGSTFWFEIELPVHESEPETKNIPGDLTGARILVIDDNHVNRSILSEQMEAWKFDGATSASGEDGLQLISAFNSMNVALDLVILDYQMPDMDGSEVLAKLKQNPETSHIPVVMLTSIDNSEVQLKLTKLKADAHLTKPARSSLLLETILQVITDNRSAQKKISKSSANTSSTDLKQSIDTNNETLMPRVLDDSNTPKPARNKTIQDIDILLAEDNEVNQIVFTQILEQSGYSFKIVENGKLALAACKSHNPKLILMDVSMPVMNGKDATKNIRTYEQEKGFPHTPIIGVTAHALNGDMEACIEAGMDDYLSKPVSPNQLIEKIDLWMSKHKSKASSL